MTVRTVESKKKKKKENLVLGLDIIRIILNNLQMLSWSLDKLRVDFLSGFMIMI